MELLLPNRAAIDSVCLAGPEGWVLPLPLTVTVLVSTYAVELPISWRIAPITAALVIALGVLERSTSSGLEVAFRRTREVILGSAVALLVSWGMSKIWAPPVVRQHDGHSSTS